MGIRWSVDVNASIRNKETQKQQSPSPNLPLQPQPISPPPNPFYDGNWVKNELFKLPHNAVYAGYDIDGKQMYVSRVFHDGDYIPAKAFNSINLATFAYNGREHFMCNFEYLVGDKYKWVPGRPFPPGAVIVNPHSTDEHLFVGRCNYSRSLICGKFVPSKNCLYLSFGLTEVPYTGDFEMLVHEDENKNDGNLQITNG